MSLDEVAVTKDLVSVLSSPFLTMHQAFVSQNSLSSKEKKSPTAYYGSKAINLLLVLTQLQVSIGVDEKARRSIVDPAVGKECSDESLKIMMELCVRCLVDKQSDRPSVEDVQWKLHFAAQVQETWKGDHSHNTQDSDISCSQV